MEERIDKILARSGYGSRKEIKQMIRAGRISLGGQPVTDSGQKISPADQDFLCLDMRPVKLYQSLVFMLNKPAGLITAIKDSHRPTVGDLIPAKWQNKGLAPVGRLDKDTEGLLILTNDGQLSHRICSPKWQIAKKYWMITEGKPFSQADQEVFSQGFTAPDGSVFLPSILEIVDKYEAFLTVYEGQYHQVKRMAKSSGREVKYLKRLQIADLELDPDLDTGQIRLLSPSEKTALYRACQLQE